MNLTLRPAIAMIELIFAIVVMGLVLMSAPMLISTATKSGYVAIQQEAIAEAASNMNIIMGHHWDEQDTNDSRTATVLVVTHGHGDLNESSAGYRLGTPNASSRRYPDYLGNDLNATKKDKLGPDAGDRDDIDDFNNPTGRLFKVENASVDNIETSTINISTKVAYILDVPAPATRGYNDIHSSDITFNPDFNGTTNSTNIKRISTTLTSIGAPNELAKKIILHAFSCNIGISEIEGKTIGPPTP